MYGAMKVVRYLSAVTDSSSMAVAMKTCSSSWPLKLRIDLIMAFET